MGRWPGCHPRAQNPTGAVGSPRSPTRSRNESARFLCVRVIATHHAGIQNAPVIDRGVSRYEQSPWINPLRIADERTPTAGLTSLRVIIHALQRFAQACNKFLVVLDQNHYGLWPVV